MVYEYLLFYPIIYYQSKIKKHIKQLKTKYLILKTFVNDAVAILQPNDYPRSTSTATL